MKKTIIFFLALFALVAFLRFFDSSWEIKNRDPKGENIICFGDSLTYGTGARAGEDYPAQLSRMINTPVLNAGIPGDTTAMALARLGEDVLSRSPRIVLVSLGANDLMRGINRETAFHNLKTIIVAIQARGALVVVGGIKFPFLDRGFAKSYKDLCQETGAVLVPDILADIITSPELMSDRIHPNGIGYGLIAERFEAALQKYL
ncbi:arylesterase [Thermodesulfobacteriota bacterium]